MGTFQISTQFQDNNDSILFYQTTTNNECKNNLKFKKYTGTYNEPVAFEEYTQNMCSFY